jgi:MFS transporter, MHS family, shikimate and dehydroshikimate transport protein
MEHPEQFAARPRPASALHKIVWSSVLGTSIEWYDFLIYGIAAALVFNKLFFPHLTPAVGTIAALGSYAVGFVARPLGGVICGHFGDRIGRKAMLSATVLIMGFGTFLIGCLPTYQQIGVAAPLLLIGLRLLQGIGVGGEWGGAVVMVLESAPQHRRGFYASLVQLGLPIGVLTSTVVFALVSRLPETEFLLWGWRVPFLLSAILVGIGWYIRLRLPETQIFREVQARGEVSKVPLFDILRDYRRSFFIAFGLRISEIAYFTVATVFATSYVTTQLGMSRSTVFNGILLAAAMELVTLPWFATLSDRYGRKPIYIAGCLISALLAWPMFWLLQSRSPIVIALTISAALNLGQGIMFAPEAAWVCELFPSRLRYSGASLGFQLGAAASGGLTPILVAALLALTGTTSLISLYLVVLAAITFVAALAAPETAHRPLAR